MTKRKALAPVRRPRAAEPRHSESEARMASLVTAFKDGRATDVARGPGRQTREAGGRAGRALGPHPELQEIAVLLKSINAHLGSRPVNA